MKQEITLMKDCDGVPTSWNVEAQLFGSWVGLHRTLEHDGSWTITHVPTGKAMVKGFKGNHKFAMWVAEAIATSVPHGDEFVSAKPRKDTRTYKAVAAFCKEAKTQGQRGVGSATFIELFTQFRKDLAPKLQIVKQ